MPKVLKVSFLISKQVEVIVPDNLTEEQAQEIIQRRSSDFTNDLDIELVFDGCENCSLEEAANRVNEETGRGDDYRLNDAGTNFVYGEEVGWIEGIIELNKYNA